MEDPWVTHGTSIIINSNVTHNLIMNIINIKILSMMISDRSHMFGTLT